MSTKFCTELPSTHTSGLAFYLIKFGHQEAEIFNFENSYFTCKTTTTSNFLMMIFYNWCSSVRPSVRPFFRSEPKSPLSINFAEILQGGRGRHSKKYGNLKKYPHRPRLGAISLRRFWWRHKIVFTWKIVYIESIYNTVWKVRSKSIM